MSRISVHNIDEVKKEYTGKKFNKLLVTNIYVKDNRCWCDCICECGKNVSFSLADVKGDRNKSCGCLNSTENKRKIMQDWCKDNPDKVKQSTEKYKLWCKNNPDAVLARAEKVSQFYKNNPEVAIIKGKKVSAWNKNNPDKVVQRVEKYKQWCENNPDEVKAKISDKMFERHRCNRAAAFTVDVLSGYITEEYITKILNGDKLETVRSKCPICGEFDDHPAYRVLLYSTGTLKDPLPICRNCQNCRSTSLTENEIYEYVWSICDSKCLTHCYDIIPPYELDIYCPDKRIAVEYNGFYWHSEQMGVINDYHFNKFKLCKEKGIRLISVFEQDWLAKKDNVLAILRNAFAETESIYARNCVISQLDYKTKSEFINKYHFYGDFNQGTISYGLYYNDELVSAMSFGKMRGNNSMREQPNHYELVRFVTKDGMSIIGGASKLFKYFIKDYNPEYILCYSDNDFFTGNVYKQLGFKLKSLGESIDYQWCKNNICLNRQSCMPCKLLEKYPQYKDINIVGSKERYIMEDLGYFRIYRCGNSIWEWYK